MNYGVWVRGMGWVKTIKGAVAFSEIEVAKDTARRVGGEVRPIDASLVDLEQNILQIEVQQDARKGILKWIKKLIKQ